MIEVDGRVRHGPGRTTAAGRAQLGAMLSPFMSGLLDALDRFDHVVGPEIALTWRAPDEWAWLATWVQKRWGLAARPLVPMLNALLTAAGNEDRAVLTACLLRALSPRSGLLTVPLRAWFNAEETLDLLAQRPPPVSPTVDLRQAVGAPLDYRGYLCVILKITRLCNLRCVYCHDWSDSPATHMDFAMLLRVTQQALGSGHGAVDFVLHGGEPLMLGRRAWLRWMLMLAHLGADHQVLRVHAQTNGVLVDDAWLDLLALFGVQASVSLDGPPALHDQQRPDALGRATHARTLAGLTRLRERGLLSGVLMVVSPQVLSQGAEALQTYFASEGIHEVALIPERPAAGQPGGVTQAAFVDFLLAFAAANRRSAGPPVSVRELAAVKRLNQGQGSGFCELAGNCVGAFVSVEASGDVSHCDKYTGSAEHVLGNLMTTPLSDILAGPAARRVAHAAYADLNALRSCPHFAKCQGWCPHERFVTPPAPGTRCCGLSRLFDADAVALTTPDPPTRELTP